MNYRIKEIISRMERRMEKISLSASKLCQYAGVDKATFSRIKNGKTKNPTIGTLEKLESTLRHLEGL